MVETPWSRLDVRADIFSMGGIMEWLFRMDLENDTQVADDLRRIISRAHAHDPEARYASADAFVNDLHQLERGEDDLGSPAFWDDLRAFSKAHPRASILAIGTSCLAVAAIATLIALI